MRIGSRPFHREQSETNELMAVRDAADAVLAPAVGSAARVFVGQVIPGVAIGDCSPRAPCPTGARQDTGPSASSSFCAGGLLVISVLLESLRAFRLASIVSHPQELSRAAATARGISALNSLAKMAYARRRDNLASRSCLRPRAAFAWCPAGGALNSKRKLVQVQIVAARGSKPVLFTDVVEKTWCLRSRATYLRILSSHARSPESI